ncbi:MAG: IMP cyclohydrolase [Candidatus Adiutrix sp.]|jgi:phosphoribosylaminoimidazolecarboxamide formyltransferase/IMP cyclohydrolase|nr:IMP cyclohydrolase [Candidatus Adiutrix sp.]
MSQQPISQQYRQILTDHFPAEISLKIGSTTLIYHKQVYKIKSGEGEISGGLRYGENPGQEAALYRLVNGHLTQTGVQYVGPREALVSALADGNPATNMMFGCGKHPSKTNLTDVDAALGILRYLADRPAAVIIKHNNPSGAALGRTVKAAFEKAWAGDRVAAFGGAAVVNRPVDRALALAINRRYLEVVAAPDFEDGSLEILGRKKDLRIFKIKNIDQLGDLAAKRFLDIKSLTDGGLILQQSALNAIAGPESFQPAQAVHEGRSYRPERKPTARELTDLVFGWAVEQGVTSNSVLLVKNGATVAIGAGGQDRVGIVEMAVWKAYRNFQDALAAQRHQMSFKELELAVEQKKAGQSEVDEIAREAQGAQAGLTGAVMISDAFFPFRDGVDVALRQGVSAIAHPGGSLRDWEVIEAVNQARPQAAMVFTGQRAFKH